MSWLCDDRDRAFYSVDLALVGRGRELAEHLVDPALEQGEAIGLLAHDLVELLAASASKRRLDLELDDPQLLLGDLFAQRGELGFNGVGHGRSLARGRAQPNPLSPNPL